MHKFRPGASVAVAVAVAAAAALILPVHAWAGPLAARVPEGGAGGIGIRLVDVASGAPSDPRAQLYIVDHLAPGTSITRRVEVTNTTTSSTHIALYAAAATIDRGSFVSADGHLGNDLASWASVTPAATDLPPGALATATVTLTVPSDAAPGEHYAVVWAETRSAPAGGAGVTQVSRVGIRLYVSVGPGGPPAAGFTIESLTASRSVDGHPVVRAAVHNTGGRALDMNGTLQLADGPGELSAGPFPVTLGTTLALGATEPVTITLDDRLPVGPWHAQLILRSGLTERVIDATITFPDAGSAPAGVATPPRSARPYASVGGFAFLLICAGVLARARRQKPTRAHRRGGLVTD